MIVTVGVLSLSACLSRFVLTSKSVLPETMLLARKIVENTAGQEPRALM